MSLTEYRFRAENITTIWKNLMDKKLFTSSKLRMSRSPPEALKAGPRVLVHNAFIEEVCIFLNKQR